MKKIFWTSLTLLLMGLIPKTWASYASMPSNYQIVNAPTAYTLLHGEYDLNLWMYQNGGLFLRGNVGLTSFFMFGFSGNATNVIGHGPIQVQDPRLSLKFKILDQNQFPFAAAVGWDDRGYGVLSGNRFVPGQQTGFYIVTSKEYSVPLFFQVHFGVNALELNNVSAKNNVAAFTGISFALAHPLIFNFELNQLFTAEWQFNANIVVNVENDLQMGLNFIDINSNTNFSRILSVDYYGFF
jgi:hypothetical protein